MAELCGCWVRRMWILQVLHAHPMADIGAARVPAFSCSYNWQSGSSCLRPTLEDLCCVHIIRQAQKPVMSSHRSVARTEAHQCFAFY